MNLQELYLFVSAVVFIFGLYEIYRVDNSKNLFGSGLFLFVVQFVILPFVIDFLSWFIKVGADSTLPVADYIEGLFLSSIFVAIYYFFRSYNYHMNVPKK
ncbi:MAG: hypothetical protein QXN26_07455 [Thermoplasmataceae archaeon]